MGPKRSDVRGRGGVIVNTVRRAGPSQAAASSSGGGGRGSGSRSSSGASSSQRKSKASARYREKAVGASRPGENFFRDSLVASQFEERVLEIYAPTPDLNESIRTLPLRLQAERDGSEFKLPSLMDICLGVVSDHFGTKVLPLLQREEQEDEPNGIKTTAPPIRRKKRRRKGILGMMVDDDDDEDDERDYIPEDEELPRSKSLRVRPRSRSDVELSEFFHERNSYLMTILPTKMTLALQALLERKSPQLLSYHVLGKYFLTWTKVAASKKFRALGTIGGTNARGIATLLRELYTAKSDSLHDKRKSASELRSLHLQAHTRLSSLQLIPLFKETSQLEEICLRGCISVTSEAIKQLVQTCGQTLQVVNLNWTGVGMEGVEEVIRECPNLEVLKVAHVRGLTDSTVPPMMDRVSRAAANRGFIPLGKLRRLKLHGTEIGNVGLGSILKHCGSRLESLDIANTHVGGMGCSQILLVLLGLEYGRMAVPFEGSNSHLQKLNLSGLSLPEREVKMIATHIYAFEALNNLSFTWIRSYNQGGGYNDLGDGVDDEGLHFLIGSLMLSALRGRSIIPEALHCGHGKQQIENQEGSRITSRTYFFEKLALANKVTGRRFDPSLLRRDCQCGEDEIDWYAVKHLDLNSLDLRKPLEQSTKWLGCQSLNLSDCKLPDDPDWDSIGASGLLRRIDLSRTTVSEEAVDRLVKENPYLTSINLTGCRGIPVTRRRNWFQTKEV